MLLENIEDFYKWILLYMICAMMYAWHDYLANQRRPADDPEKRYYPAFLIVLAPITLPISLLVSFFVFLMKAVLYGLSLAVFTIGLLLNAAFSVARN